MSNLSGLVRAQGRSTSLREGDGGVGNFLNPFFEVFIGSEVRSTNSGRVLFQ